MFIRAHPGCRWVHSGSLGSFGHVELVVPVHWVHLCEFWWWSGSFGFVAFTLTRYWGHCIHSGAPWRSFGSFRRALRSEGSYGCVDLFEHALGDNHYVLLGSFGRLFGVVGFIWGRWVHSAAPWWSSSSFLFFGFIRALTEHVRVHSASLMGAPWWPSR